MNGFVTVVFYFKLVLLLFLMLDVLNVKINDNWIKYQIRRMRKSAKKGEDASLNLSLSNYCQKMNNLFPKTTPL